MKKLIAGLLFICFFAFTISAQNGKAREKLEAQKVAFITQKLELTTKEAEVFWPMYNDFQRDKEAINQKYKTKKRIQNMSDAELESQILGSFKKDQELLNLRKSFFEKMKTKFSVRRIATLFQAEKEFRTTILTEWKKRQKERRQQRRQNMQRN